MLNTATHKELGDEIERLVGQLDASIPQALTQAVQSFLTAITYNDLTLMRSHLNAALEALQQTVYEAVQQRLGWPQHASAACRKIGDIMNGCPSENWDEAGTRLESRFDEMVKILTDLRAGPVELLQKHGYPIENAAQLEDDIRELQELKQRILSSWPWSNRELPPVDRTMVAQSRAAIRRKEGEPIEALIRRLGGHPAKGGQECP